MTSRLATAERAVTHATRGVARAQARCDKQWDAWLGATDDRRRALEIKAEALREAEAARAEAGT